MYNFITYVVGYRIYNLLTDDNIIKKKHVSLRIRVIFECKENDSHFFVATLIFFNYFNSTLDCTAAITRIKLLLNKQN